MRSSAATLFLAVLAILLGSLSAIQLSQSNLNTIFGEPPLARGDRLFDFDPKSISRLYVTNSTGTTASFHWENQRWTMKKPSEDRADYRHLQSLVLATYTLRIDDVIPLDDLDLKQAGFGAGHYEIKLVDVPGNIVAHYHLGRPMPWHQVPTENGQPVETFYIRPADRDDLVYVCSDPSSQSARDPAKPPRVPIFKTLRKSGLNTLRDHRPFLFNHANLAEVRIRHKNGELTVQRETRGSLWRITKPLELRTDHEAVTRLAMDLYKLEGLAVHDPDSVTIPARTGDDPELEITLSFLGEPGNLVVGPTLTVEPPASEDAKTVYAQVSNRDAVFELPLNPTSGRTALAQIPVSVDDLRSRTLSSFQLADLRSITLHAPGLEAPLVMSLGRESISRRPRWMISQGPARQPANEATVARLFTALAMDKVMAFTSDAAADLKPFGLDPPAKRIVLNLGSKDPIELLFGASAEGRYYAMRSGTTTVAEIGYGTWSRIAVTPFSWRDSLLWPFPIVDLAELRIERPGAPPLDLTYDFIQEAWTAHRKGADVTHLLNVQRATILANNLESLRVNRWIGPDSREARLRLGDPSLTIEAVYRTVDDEGMPAGKRRILMDLVPAADRSQLYYGRLSGDLDFFLMDKGSYDLVDVPLLEE